MALDIANDPVLRLLPVEGMPDGFLTMSADEQSKRGRLWLTLYGAGYQQDHAWWFVMQQESDIAEMLAEIKDVPDDWYPAMLQGRQRYEAGKTVVPSDVTQ